MGGGSICQLFQNLQLRLTVNESWISWGKMRPLCGPAVAVVFAGHEASPDERLVARLRRICVVWA
jgi:hypothetical protein